MVRNIIISYITHYAGSNCCTINHINVNLRIFFLFLGFPLGGPGSLYGDYSPSHVSHSGRSMFGDIPPTPGSGSITLPGSLESKFSPNIITQTEKNCIFHVYMYRKIPVLLSKPPPPLSPKPIFQISQKSAQPTPSYFLCFTIAESKNTAESLKLLKLVSKIK